MPNKGKNIVEFRNYHKQMPVPFVIYAGFGAITEKVQGCQPYGDKSYIRQMSEAHSMQLRL